MTVVSNTVPYIYILIPLELLPTRHRADMCYYTAYIMHVGTVVQNYISKYAWYGKAFVLSDADMRVYHDTFAITNLTHLLWSLHQIQCHISTHTHIYVSPRQICHKADAKMQGAITRRRGCDLSRSRWPLRGATRNPAHLTGSKLLENDFQYFGFY